ncbi:MAG: phosphate ABC transporter substrate-binding protein [Brevefilum sp.]|nr:phosphate ABC transporter substrate-binding protein [Brevefilum sp.]
MRRKSLIVSILVLVLAVLFSACTPDLSLEPAAPQPAETDALTAPEGDQPSGETNLSAPEEETQTGLKGQIQIAGSTTVQPLSEKLALAFMAINPDLVIEVQGGGSSVGVTAAGEGTVNIGQVSREIKSSEFEAFPDLQVFTIAYDGIAIVTHPDLELPSITLEEAKRIFGGEITNYAEVGGPDADIIVVSREEGSGTRAAFDELVLESSEPELEMTETALLQQSNGQVRTTVSTTPYAIGYLSFGFLDESVNLVEINGFQPTVDNVLAGNYPVFRPLNLTTNGDPDDLSQAFLDFVLSSAGQQIVSEDYIPAVGEDAGYVPPSDLAGQIQVAGSTTVQPLTEKLALAFMEYSPSLVIEVQGGGSSVGVTAAGEGTVNIGQVSREIKSSEFEAFPDLQVFTIAYDGIAIVTHPDLQLPSITLEEAKRIFGGEITNYAEIGGPDADIIVVSREEGSGTRAAFDELVLESSEPELQMAATALLQQSNGQVRTTVATTPFAIGYLSFGFLDESINLVEVDSYLPTVENVLAGHYPIFRPLNLTTLGDPDELSRAFLDFILSNFGQVIVSEDYIRAR